MWSRSLSGRSWDGLHRHLTVVMLAYTFLMLQALGQEVQTDPASGAVFPPTRQLSLPAAGTCPAVSGRGIVVD